MEKKIRHSHQRDRIYEYLVQSREHPSAERIYSDLRPEIPGLSLGTVYRNLKLLEELGKIRRVTSFQGTERYDAICEDHAHCLCQRCGRLVDMAAMDADAIRAALHPEAGFSITKLDITVTGICPNCAE